MKKLKGLKFFFAFLLFALGMDSCGIESYVTLYPPNGSALSSFPLDFTHNTSNASDTNFLGYEIYYRLYDGTVSTPSSLAATDRTNIEANWASALPSTIFARLKAAGYMRVINLSSANPRSAPLLAITNSDAQKQIFSVFTLSEVSTMDVYVDNVASQHFELRRNEFDTVTQDYRKFSDALKGADSAYASGVTEPSHVYIQIYCLAYGFDKNFQIVTSKPLLLTNGAIKIF